MKKLVGMILIALFAGLFVSPGTILAADEAVTNAAPKLMTQGELAQLLVKKLGLYRFVPANPSDMECISILFANGVFPSPTLPSAEGGWNAQKEVNVADFARILVRAFGLQGEVKDPTSDQAWLDVLQQAKVPVDTVGAGVAALRPFSEILTAVPLFQITQDPLDKRYIPLSDIVDLLGLLTLPAPNNIPVEVKEEIKKPTPATPT